MPYDFPPNEQQQITAYYAQGPAVGELGYYAPMYAYIAQRLELPAQTDPDVGPARAWFRVATDANQGIGPFSAIIREYTKQQGLLHGYDFADVQRPGMTPEQRKRTIQESSSNVARNVYDHLVDGSPAWRAPTIHEIANADASAIGKTLFPDVPADTAYTQNAAWTGVLLFKQLSSDQSSRLMRGSGDADKADTVDDWRNILYAQNAYLHAYDVATSEFGAADMHKLVTGTYMAVCEGARRNLVEGCIIDVIAGTDIAPYFLTATQFRGTGCRTADLFQSGFTGRAIGGPETLAVCHREPVGGFRTSTANPAYIASPFRALGTDGQNIAAHYVDAPKLLAGATGTGADRDEARQALDGLSPFLISGGLSPVPDPELAEYSERYYADRADMLDARLIFDRRGETYGDDEPYVPDFPRNATFRDLRDGMAFSIDNSPLPLPSQQVVYGTTNGDTLEGGVADDAFYGRDGADTLDGGAGDNHLEGGAGNDTYIIDGARDAIVDSDGQGSINFNGVVLDGGARIGVGTWRSANDRFRYTKIARDGRTDLLVTDTTASGSVEIRGYVSNALGISLANENDAQPPSDTTAPDARAFTNRRDLYESPSPLGDLIFTGPQYDYVGGSQGNDTIVTGDGSDRVLGGAGADSIAGENGNDYLLGGSSGSTDPAVIAGDLDLVEGGAGTDNLGGGVGNDSIYATQRGDAIDSGGTNAQGDWLVAGKGDDQVFGSNQRDFGNGGGGADILVGGAGDDVLLGDGAYDFTLTTTTMTIDNNTPGFAARHTWDTATSSWRTVVSGSLPAGDAIAIPLTSGLHFQWTLGLSGDDFAFTPATARSTLVRVDADGGSDLLRGGPGSDWLGGQTGDDVLFGEAGDDRLVGDDLVALPAGSAAGKDRLYGGDGTDRLFGNENDDILYGENGDDVLYGDDEADAAGGKDRLFGGDGADQLYGRANADQLYGGDGHDNPLDGGEGGDEIRGGAGNDVLLGDGAASPGNDILSGDDGDDQLVSNGGTDQLLGGDGADQLDGGDGNDELVGGRGIDTLAGGSGNDAYVFATGDDDGVVSTIDDSGSGNRIVFRDAVYPSAVRIVEDGGDALIAYSTRDTVRVVGGAGGAVVGTFEFADGRVVAYGALTGSGTRPVDAPSAHADAVTGTVANDTLALLDGDDSAYGDSGDDTLDGGNGSDDLDGGDGADTLIGGGAGDGLRGGIGNDTLNGGDGDDALAGGAGNDALDGGIGTDRLDGGSGDDTLVGDTGNDTLIGGGGVDLLQGGPGADVYVFGAGDDPDAATTPATRIADIDDFANANTLRFDGVAVDDVTLTRSTDAFVTLRVSYATANGTGVFDVQCGSAGKVIDRFTFDDGTSYTLQQMLDRQGLGLPSTSAVCGNP